MRIFLKFALLVFLPNLILILILFFGQRSVQENLFHDDDSIPSEISKKESIDNVLMSKKMSKE